MDEHTKTTDEDVLSFGESLSYKWKYIEIDPPFGVPILFNGKEIGGFLIRPETWKGEVEVVMFEGIEIDPEYRGKGIGTDVVNMVLEQCDLLIGSITEDEPKPFWLKMGAEFRPIPIDCFPARTLHTVHTETPVFFFITQHEQGRKWAEIFAREVPGLMKQLQ